MPLRALLIVSLYSGAFALGRQPTARYVNKLSLVEGGGETGSGCPSELKGVLFNHIQKTGGTVMVALLESIFTEPTYVTQWKSAYNQVAPQPKGVMSLIIENDEAKVKIAEEDMNQYFTIGLIRRPCDYLLSRWVQACNSGSQEEYCTSKNKSEFKRFVTQNVESPTMFEVSPLVSFALSNRYAGGDRLHCYIRLHNLEDDLLACVSKYEACGGVVDHALLSHDHLASAMDIAATRARKHGRSVGDHAACTDMFDAEMLSEVLQTEQAVIDKFQLGECCSPGTTNLLVH